MAFSPSAEHCRASTKPCGRHSRSRSSPATPVLQNHCPFLAAPHKTLPIPHKPSLQLILLYTPSSPLPGPLKAFSTTYTYSNICTSFPIPLQDPKTNFFSTAYPYTSTPSSPFPAPKQTFSTVHPYTSFPHHALQKKTFYSATKPYTRLSTTSSLQNKPSHLQQSPIHTFLQLPDT